jgi:Ca2+-binding EF-hand superfamily protein
MMKGSKMLIWTVALAVLLGACATTETPSARKDYDQLCTALGKESKGQISKEEFVTGAKDKKEAGKLFELCDVNRDGYLSFEEYLNQQRMIHNVMGLTPPPLVKPVR